MCVCVPIHSYMIHTLYIYLFSHSHKSYGEEKRRRKEEPLAHKRSLSHRPASLVALTARSRKCLPSFKKKKATTTKKRSFLPPCFSRWRAHSSRNSCVSIPKCADGRVPLFFEASGCLSTFHFPSTSLFFLCFSSALRLPEKAKRSRNERRHRREKKGKQPTGTRNKRRQGKRKHKRQNGFFCRKNSIMWW